MSATKDLADLAQRFDADRRRLRSNAFQLLGSVADADDVVQSAWLKASRADYGAVENLTGWFTTIVAREALDQLRVRKRRAEQLLAETDELDRLSPAQRVAFVLHDVFAMPFEQIAAVTNRSEDAAKKLASRARARLHADPAAQPRRTADHLKVVEAFLRASRSGDIAGLLELLAPEVVRTVDPALVPADVPTTMRGADQVARETRRFARRARAGAVMLIDGAPGIVIAARGRAQVLLVIGIGADDRIHTIDITGNAERIRRAALALPRWPTQEYHNLVAYQGRQTQVAGEPAASQDRGSHAR
ncbi:sigma factor-like helix-turn-helix DNA-binding protein [Mycobacterium sp.]|uniref:sigma factor-like helix-turn-helix DNA-binding protein n=1 Tax=Mycobacterium sp. TaxID=1785 RepID=UPI003F7F1648